MRKPTLVMISILVVFILTAQDCGGAREFIVVDLREKLGEVTTEQSSPVDNTRSNEDLSQDIAARKQFRHTITLRLNPGAGLDEARVRERILDAYNIPGMGGEKLCLIPADVPAGRSYAYNLEWTQVLREGNIEAGPAPGQGEIYGTYSIVVDMQCQVTGVQVIR